VPWSVENGLKWQIGGKESGSKIRITPVFDALIPSRAADGKNSQHLWKPQKGINLRSHKHYLHPRGRPETQKRKLALHALPAGIISSPEASEECLDGIESRYVDKGQFFSNSIKLNI